MKRIFCRTSVIRWYRLNLAFLLSVLAIPACGWSQESPPSPSQPEGEYRISTEADLVVLPVTVRDREGGFVSRLEKENFRVFENGVQQEIQFVHHEDVPVTAGLVIDSSGSMRAKLPEVGIAALVFAHSSNKRDELFVVSFNEKASLALPEDIPFTDSFEQLTATFSRIKADGRTALYDAVALGLDHLKMGQQSKKVLIVVSDGGDNSSSLTRDQVMAMAKKSDAIIYTIGLFDDDDPDRNPGVLKQLAKVTGGEAFFPQATSEVVAICKRIAEDIRNQYTIGYVPLNRKRDGTYRTIRVTVFGPNHRKLIARTRAGYTAPSEDRSPLSSTTEVNP